MKSVLFFLLIGIANLSIAQTVAEIFAEAEVALENENYKTALKKATYVIENDVPRADYFYVKARAELYLGNYQDAYDTYSRGIDDLPKSSKLYNDRGTLLYQLQNFDMALADYTKAIELAETDSIKCFIYSNRSTTKMSVRNFEGAYDDLMLAYNLDSTSLGVLTNLGVVCDEIGRGDETLKYLLKAVEIDSEYYGAYANIGFKYQNSGEHEKSVEYYNKVLELRPEEPLGFSNRAYSRMKLGDLKGAMDDVNKSLDIYPENAYAYRNRALIYIEMDKIKKACNDLQAAIDRGFTGMYGEEVEELLAKYCK